MLVDQYVKALLRDADLTDAVWELWNARLLSDSQAVSLWAEIAHKPLVATAGTDDL